MAWITSLVLAELECTSLASADKIQRNLKSLGDALVLVISFGAGKARWNG